MKIALIGYGKMGHAIEKIALGKGYDILYKIDVDNKNLLEAASLSRADVAIEFTSPETAYHNILKCFEANVPVVCGTTGWLEKWEEIKHICLQKNQAMVYASNYSIGVNIFFELNKHLAALMAAQPQYEVTMEEIHHTQKKDAPSGTAITLAEQILNHIPRKKNWVNRPAASGEELSVISKRIDPAPGTHIVKYTSTVDDIEIIHTAHSREGFAAGAVTAAEWIIGKKGVFSMKDVLNF